MHQFTFIICIYFLNFLYKVNLFQIYLEHKVQQPCKVVN